jgi:hypothetical protein
MRVIAFYLPQFHTFSENDEWWGKGFTEWTNTKKSKPLFVEHYQPRIPLNDNYYDLSTVEPMRRQAEMAKEYGVDAFCFYHYWFKDGKKLMAKPLENFLKAKDIDIEFCLSWANEPWTRAWDGGKGSRQILMPQEYGTEDEWKQHFDYFLPFFKDNRYILIDNKPLVVIYRPDLIPEFWKMINYWNKRAKCEGFEGIVTAAQGVGACANFDYDKTNFDYIIEFEPLYTKSILRKKTMIKHPSYLISGFKAWMINEKTKMKSRKQEQLEEPVFIFDYDAICQSITYRKPYTSNLVPGMSPSWDNSPRRGKNAMIFNGSTPEKFEHYMELQLKRAKNVYHQDMLFINAWNEWAEGAYLEPDQKYGYSYLESIKKARNNTGI